MASPAREGLFLAVTLRNDLREGRNEHGKTTALLRLEDDRKTVVRCHLLFLHSLQSDGNK
jgi:hypothetical protein